MTERNRVAGWSSAVIGAATVFTVILSGIGIAGASTVTAVPYHGSTSIVSEYLNPILPSNCQGAQLTAAPHWTPKTGSAGFAEKAFAKSSGKCGNCSYYYCYAPATTANVQETIAVPFTIPSTSGYYTVLANWSLHYAATWSVTHGACPKAVIVNGNGFQDCYVTASFSLNFASYCVVDLTLGTSSFCYYNYYGSFGNTSTWYRDYSCSTYQGTTNCNLNNGSSIPQSGSVSAGMMLNDYLNYTYLNASHRYALETSIAASLTANAYGDPSPFVATGSASVNLATHGNYLRLVGISVY